jgi:hypothetical protein
MLALVQVLVQGLPLCLAQVPAHVQTVLLRLMFALNLVREQVRVQVLVMTSVGL